MSRSLVVGRTPTVLITGAAGRVGRYLRAGLPALGWQLRLFDRLPMPEVADLPEAHEAIVADIRDGPALAAALRGVSAVVHLAGVVKPADSFAEVLAGNIEGTYELLRRAQEASVERVVFASTNHVNGFAPRSAAGPPGGDRPDSFYGVSKLFGEALGRLYADRYGMRIACLRIGSCFDRPTDPRMLATWLSPGDASRLVHACLTSPDLGYAVVYGLSANTRRWWDLAPAEALGYDPQDDAEAYAAEILAPYGGVDPGSPDDPQGGGAAWRAGDGRVAPHS
jgi:uronate dehydrogenase